LVIGPAPDRPDIYDKIGLEGNMPDP
jgi:hypothetical protein